MATQTPSRIVTMGGMALLFPFLAFVLFMEAAVAASPAASPAAAPVIPPAAGEAAPPAKLGLCQCISGKQDLDFSCPGSALACQSSCGQKFSYVPTAQCSPAGR